MAYDPAKRAAREATFRAEHGVSSGTYYSMRRQAAAGGINPKTFDRTAQRHGYGVAKQITIEQRQMYRASEGGRIRGADFDWDITEYEDLDIDREWFWLKSPGK
jgi:hypothetical protein